MGGAEVAVDGGTQLHRHAGASYEHRSPPPAAGAAGGGGAAGAASGAGEGPSFEEAPVGGAYQADGELAAFFTAKDEAFMLRRTRSRLLEMCEAP